MSESSFYVYVQFFVECFRTKTSQCLVKAFSVVSSFMARIHIRLNVSKISESSFYVLECFRNNHSLCLVIWVAQDSVRLAFEILHCLPWSKPRTSLLLVHPGHHPGFLIVLWRFHLQQQSGHVGSLRNQSEPRTSPLLGYPIPSWLPPCSLGTPSAAALAEAAAEEETFTGF